MKAAIEPGAISGEELAASVGVLEYRLECRGVQLSEPLALNVEGRSVEQIEQFVSWYGLGKGPNVLIQPPGTHDALLGELQVLLPVPTRRRGQMWEQGFEQVAGESLITTACPQASTLCVCPAGDIAGLLLVYPHYGPIVVQGAGADRVPVRALDYATHMPTLEQQVTPQGILRTVGTHPGHRRKGIQQALGLTAVENTPGKYRRWGTPLMHEDNPSRRPVQAHTEETRWYGLFSKPLTP